MAAAKAPASGGSARPAPSATISRQILTRSETITGVPQAIASTTAMPKFSLEEGSRKRSASLKAASLSRPVSIPVKLVRAARPASVTHRRAAPSIPPSGPAMTRWASMPAPRVRATAWISTSSPFLKLSRDRKSRIGRWPISGCRARKLPRGGRSR